jgi:hypothetical protein
MNGPIGPSVVVAVEGDKALAGPKVAKTVTVEMEVTVVVAVAVAAASMTVTVVVVAMGVVADDVSVPASGVVVVVAGVTKVVVDESSEGDEEDVTAPGSEKKLNERR